MIPKFSAPLSKLIRTTEGVILALFNAATLVGVIVNDVSPATGLKYAAIFNTVAFASRQFLKAVAVIKPSVGGDPITPSRGGVTSDQMLAEIDAVGQAISTVQSRPGTPYDQVTAGLSPDQPAAAATPSPNVVGPLGPGL